MGIKNNNKGINIIEVVVIIALVGVMMAVAFLSVQANEKKSRDTERISDIAQIGRFFYKECYLPKNGGGEYDLAQVLDKLLEKFPGQKKYLQGDLFDPKSGSKLMTNYKYNVTSDGQHCVLYANLEGANKTVTLPDIHRPTMGGKVGVFKAAEHGWNGGKKYYQISR